MNDLIDYRIKQNHIVAVCADVTLETVDENVTKVIHRGVYTFASENAARLFTSNVNDTTETKTAHYFSRNK